MVMLKSKTATAARIEVEIGKNPQSKRYLEAITMGFKNAKTANIALDSSSVYNSYITAIVKCCTVLGNQGVLDVRQITKNDIASIAIELTEKIMK